MNWWKCCGIVLFLCFIIGCAPQQDALENQTVTEDKTIVINDTISRDKIVGNKCGGWICISSTVKAQQYENCSVGQREECPDKCEDGVCKKVERVVAICTTGFKCMNERTKAFQQEDCSWISRTDCEWGCVNAVCAEKPNITEQPVEVDTTPVVDVQILHVGEVHTLSNGQYN